MGMLTVARSGDTERVPAGLEERLQWLSRFGKPRLGIYSSRWSASIEMNTNTTGASFDIKSGYDHAAPAAAVDELIQRMLEALAKLDAAA